jgi:hypothetical protein
VPRNRLLYFAGVLLVIASGLASRRYASALPSFIARYAGDTLWAVMVFGIIGLIAARWSTARVAAVTLLVSYGVEISQLNHAAWIDSIRNTRLGGLVLGYGFLWSDIVCYTVGVALCVGLERLGRAVSLEGHIVQ